MFISVGYNARGFLFAGSRSAHGRDNAHMHSGRNLPPRLKHRLLICSQNRLRNPTAERASSTWPGVETASAGHGTKWGRVAWRHLREKAVCARAAVAGHCRECWTLPFPVCMDGICKLEGFADEIPY
jgi:hypothetical protein